MVPIEQIIEECRVAATNAKYNQSVYTALIDAGFDSTKLDEGLQLCETARTWRQAQGDAYEGKVLASQGFQEFLEEARAHVHYDTRIARMVCASNSAAYQLLRLNEKRTHEYTRWHAQAGDFYRRLSTNSELQALVHPWGLTQTRIEKGMQLLAALDTARLHRHEQKGNSLNMRRQRDEVIEAVKTWNVTFRKFVRLALAGKPELMQVLGIKPIVRKLAKKKDEQPVGLPIEQQGAEQTSSTL